MESFREKKWVSAISFSFRIAPELNFPEEYENYWICEYEFKFTLALAVKVNLLSI